MDKTGELSLDQRVLSQWIGKSEEKTDQINAKPANFLKATLNQEGKDYKDGDILPPSWHWMYFLEAAPMDQLGRDGHPKVGNFLPPVALPGRMWAGGRLKFHHPVIIGEKLVKTSTISSVIRKSGRTGELCFVTVSHRYCAGTILKLEEDHDIVYREKTTTDAHSGSPSDSAPPAPVGDDISVTIEPTTTMLFRYSALTFNGHRIHYDLDYCKNIEGYPGLVVHAPLTVTLALDLATRYFRDRVSAGKPDCDFSDISIRMISPLFHHRPFTLHLKQQNHECRLWAANPDGKLAMSATLVLA